MVKLRGIAKVEYGSTGAVPNKTMFERMAEGYNAALPYAKKMGKIGSRMNSDYKKGKCGKNNYGMISMNRL